MSLHQSNAFFKKLKETCKNIDNNVSEIKKKLNEIPEDAAYSAAKCVTDIQERIGKLKTDSNELKFKLEPNLAHSTDFIGHFRDLIAETEVSVTNLENYLKQYGYKPLNVTNSPSPEKSDVSPVKNECYQGDEVFSKTPNLLDYGIASYSHSASSSKHKERESFEDLAVPPMMQLNCAKDKEKSGSTPTLEIDFILHVKEKTPPMPEFPQSVAQFPTTPKLEL